MDEALVAVLGGPSPLINHSHNQPLEVPSGCVALDSFDLFFENAGLEHLPSELLERSLLGILLNVFLDLSWLGLD